MSPFTIWKFPLPTDTDEFTVNMGGGVILTLQLQDDVPCLWSTVLPEHVYPVSFVWVGTGQPIPDKIKSHSQSYTGTVQLANGLVLHLFRIWP